MVLPVPRSIKPPRDPTRSGSTPSRVAFRQFLLEPPRGPTFGAFSDVGNRRIMRNVARLIWASVQGDPAFMRRPNGASRASKAGPVGQRLARRKGDAHHRRVFPRGY